jgi:myosin-1
LSGLIQKLLKCNPHYVRCVKPNDEKRAGMLDEQRTRHQIRYLGLVENIRVRRAGFANRQTYERFFNRYRILLAETYPIFKNTPKHGAEIIIKALGIPPEEVRFGKTKVFLKSPKTVSASARFTRLRTHRLVSVVLLGGKARQRDAEGCHHHAEDYSCLHGAIQVATAQGRHQDSLVHP